MALGFMRRHHGLLKWSLAPLLLGFVWIYVPTLTGQGDSGTPNETLGSVGNLRITASEFQKAYYQKRQEVNQMSRGRVDPEMMKRLGIPEQVFESLVQQRLFEIEAQRLGIHVDDAAVAQSIQANPRLQRDGHPLSAAELRRALSNAGMSEEEFVASSRDALIERRLEDLVTAGVSVSADEAEREYRRRNEQVKAAYVHIDAARFKDPASVSDEEARAVFDRKKDAYKIDEKRIVSYLLIDPQALQARVTVTPADVQKYYTAHQEEFRQEAQVCASHILVRVKASPEAKDGHLDADAKQIAEGMLAELKAGTDFSTLAKKSSEDPGSQHSGGELGCFARGSMVKEFEDVAFDLEPGKLSNVVKTSFGYHIIRVTSRKPEATQTLEQARPRITQTLLGEGAQSKAEDQAQTVASHLAKGKTLEEAAKELSASVLKSAPFAKGETPDPLSSPTLVAKAFELKQGEVAQEPFSTPRGFAFIALAQIVASHTPEWAEAKDRVKADLVLEKAFAKAKDTAEQVQKKAAKEGLDKAATSLGLVRKETQGLVGRGQSMGDLSPSAALDAAAFSLPEKQISEPVKVADGYAVIEILEKKPFDPAAFGAARATFTAGLLQEKKGKLFQSYMGGVRRRVTVEKVPDVYRRYTAA